MKPCLVSSFIIVDLISSKQGSNWSLIAKVCLSILSDLVAKSLRLEGWLLAPSILFLSIHILLVCGVVETEVHWDAGILLNPETVGCEDDILSWHSDLHVFRVDVNLYLFLVGKDHGALVSFERTSSELDKSVSKQRVLSLAIEVGLDVVSSETKRFIHFFEMLSSCTDNLL